MIRRQIVMPVSPERLWEALTDPDEMSGWFGAQVEWDLEEGGPARFRGDDGSERVGVVEAVRPGRHLRFRWWPAAEGGGAGGAAGAGNEGDVSEVSYVLEPAEEGTRLTVQERRIGASGAAGAQACAGGQAASWTPWDGRLLGAWAGLAVRGALASARA
jgi:uncharacterized protein YndB with AHSA1/START domain